MEVSESPKIGSSLARRVRVARVGTEADRSHAIAVLRSTYVDEKNWIQDEQKFFPSSDLDDPNISWFTALNEGEPIGVLRVMYAPPLDLYREYGFKILDGGLDVEEFLKNNRIAEIGRFAVVPNYRKYIIVAAALIQAATRETIERDFTHYVTDIFEGETHNPYDFHTRVLGFKPVATHDSGELNCPNRRITLVLDIKEGFRRIQTKQRWIYRFLTRDWDDSLVAKLGNGVPTSAMKGRGPKGEGRGA